MITVHMIFSAHVDPIWLWHWTSGLDTLLATCRSACERLDAHPDLHFVRNEAWGYDLIERISPPLFERIRRHVAAGRWHIVGGWWIQPDCNGPGGEGLRRQIALGHAYFRDRFGFVPRTAYNIDTFGHAATLPDLLRAAGQDRYVMMRPQEHELELPARLFRWRSREGGPEVVTFRVARGYACREITLDHVRPALTHLPPGIDHTMCFVGLGDHGGGPTERQIAWCREHRDALPGARLIFSSPDAFFDAIWDRRETLPVVTGELQMHAVGCYSVHRAVKVGVRRAEHALAQAEVVRAIDPRPEPQTEARLAEAWQRVCFHHFHDTYGGTCVPSAYEIVHAQLGQSLTLADEIVQLGFRRRLEALPDDPHHRIALLNASDEPFDGYTEFEPWNERIPFDPRARLLDEDGRALPYQRLATEAVVPPSPYFTRLLFRVRLAPGELRALRLAPPDPQAPPQPARVRQGPDSLASDTGVALRLAGAGSLDLPGSPGLALPRLDLLEDLSDTWSHDIDRYDDYPLASAAWHATRPLDAGPLMAALQQLGRIGRSDLVAEWRIYADEPCIELRLRIFWAEQRRLLKLTWPLPAALVRHTDGIPAGELVRHATGREHPARDRSLLELEDGRRLGLVLPDAYALDARPQRVRVTLLRSPLMAHHDPYLGPWPRGVYADQGPHEFRFRFFGGPELTGDLLDRQALMFHRPLVAADLTRGMPAV